MATANFTTKPPMLDENNSDVGFQKLNVSGSIVWRTRSGDFLEVVCWWRRRVVVIDMLAKRGGKLQSETRVEANGV